MWRTLLLLAVGAAVAYLWLYRVENITVIEKNLVVGETPIRRLSAFVDSHHGEVFAPLGVGDTVISGQELRQIESSLRDLQAGARSDIDRKIYATGLQICMLLQRAMGERKKHERRLAEMRAKGFDVPLATPERRAEEIEKKRRFFEGGVQRSWENVSDKMRAEVDRHYDYLRLLER
jgi:hypothetical protein